MTQEEVLNTRPAGLLAACRPEWSARPEEHCSVNRSSRADMLVTEPGEPPVVIECKRGMRPEDRQKRLDDAFRTDGTRVRLLFEVKYPEDANGGGVGVVGGGVAWRGMAAAAYQRTPA